MSGPTPPTLTQWLEQMEIVRIKAEPPAMLLTSAFKSLEACWVFRSPLRDASGVDFSRLLDLSRK